jgi:hypothetical protein
LREKVAAQPTDEGFSQLARMWRQPLIRPSGTFSLKGRRETNRRTL